ncbi:MAG: hypothetical protein U1E15_13335 [Hyphomicrobiales bacterium]
MNQQLPHMDAGGLECFKAHMTPETRLLEYGSGGSTIYAARTAGVKSIISVDSDTGWLNKVQVETGGPQPHIHLNYVNIGETGNWGRPKNGERLAHFWQYMATPWRTARQTGVSPNVVLVDGRFRVACFLFSLKAAAPGTVILFDDYANRPNYHVVETFCPRASTHGRMGRFIVHKNYDDLELTTAIAAFSINPE